MRGRAWLLHLQPQVLLHLRSYHVWNATRAFVCSLAPLPPPPPGRVCPLLLAHLLGAARLSALCADPCDLPGARLPTRPAQLPCPRRSS